MRIPAWRRSHQPLDPLLMKLSKPLFFSVRHLASPSTHAHPYRPAKLPPSDNAATHSNTAALKVATKASTFSPPSFPAPTLYPNSALNPPSTTRPPVFVLPEKTDAIPIYKYYFNLGKTYLDFYKNGLKGIYRNYKIAEGLPNRPSYPLFVSRHTLYAAAMAKRLSRAELQLIIRLRADTKVLPLFALVFICCGELTPLLVPWLTAIVPPTVHIPVQTKSLRRKAEKIRQQARLEGPPEWRIIRNIWDIKLIQVQDKDIGAVKRRLAKELGLYPHWWKRLPWMLDSLPVERHLMRRLLELQYDDITIIRDGGVKEMLSEEVIMACDRRGLAVEGKEDKDLRRMLEDWLKDRSSDRAQEFIGWVCGRERNDWKGVQ